MIRALVWESGSPGSRRDFASDFLYDLVQVTALSRLTFYLLSEVFGGEMGQVPSSSKVLIFRSLCTLTVASLLC